MPKFNRQDNDGHKYQIPEQLLSKFDNAIIQLGKTKRFSDAWYDWHDDIADCFQQYMIG